MKVWCKLFLFTAISWVSFGFPSQASVQSSYYFPKYKSCTVYKGGIESEKAFTFWLENKRQFTIKADNAFQVAVTAKGKIVAPYQVDSISNRQSSKFTYRTFKTGNYTVIIKGISIKSDITICLN